ncbi:hypothetical protein [Myxosarcina sp. GI1(2024)]
MSIPMNERRDDIIYFLLNKVKRSGEETQDISYTKDDFGGKVVEKDEVVRHLNFAIESGYLTGEAVDNTSSDDDSVLAVCKNAQLTTEGRNVLKRDYFKV